MIVQLPQACRVLGNRPQGRSGRLLSLDKRLDFRPGQLVSLALALGGTSRLYSIASAPGAAELEIIYNRVDDGELTPRLWEAAPGDAVFVQGPRGHFTEPDGAANQWWIANGTGVSPYVAMVRHRLASAGGLAGRTLLFGCRHPEDAWYADLIARACAEAGLSALVCLSGPGAEAAAADHPVLSRAPLNAGRPPAGLEIFAGRLTAWPGLDRLPADDLALLCGSSLMIAEVRDRLLARGRRPDTVFAESYF